MPFGPASPSGVHEDSWCVLSPSRGEPSEDREGITQPKSDFKVLHRRPAATCYECKAFLPVSSKTKPDPSRTQEPTDTFGAGVILSAAGPAVPKAAPPIPQL